MSVVWPESQPPSVAAVTGYDAISHAVESFVTTRRTEISDLFARDAWRRLDRYYERARRRSGPGRATRGRWMPPPRWRSTSTRSDTVHMPWKV